MNITEIRKQRDTMLEATDKFMVVDRAMSEEERQGWVDYRQALRDITMLTEFSPENDFWPLPPKRYNLPEGETINLPVDYADQY